MARTPSATRTVLTGKARQHPVLATAILDIADAAAIQALGRGMATEDQQIRALRWILGACGLDAVSFQESDPYATAFREGKRFVGLQILNAQEINLGKLRQRENG